MKKMILLSTVLGVALLMTSCLEEGSRNYAESSVAYIAQDDISFAIYGKTLTGRIITSQQMQMMQPGTFKFLTYSWEEEYGQTKMGEFYLDNVVISGDPVPLDQTTLNLGDTAQEVSAKFLAIDPPYYFNDENYLGDHWLFEYAYEAKKGETAVVSFYKIGDPEAVNNEIKIDIHLAIEGTPEAGSSVTSKIDIIALNMAPLRAAYEGASQTATKELKITFRYYLKGQERPVDLQQTYRMIVAGD